MFMLTGIFLMYVSLPLIHKSEGARMYNLGISVLCIGLVLSFFWMSAMIFYLWCTIK